MHTQTQTQTHTHTHTHSHTGGTTGVDIFQRLQSYDLMALYKYVYDNNYYYFLKTYTPCSKDPRG